MSKTTLFDSRIKKYAYREAAQLYGELGSSPAGLSPEQVERQPVLVVELPPAEQQREKERPQVELLLVEFLHTKQDKQVL